jgi:maleylpyruvate isomerase
VPLPGDADSADAILADVGTRTLDLLYRASLLTEAAVGEPSRLPGWTRGHVLAHLSDNADAFTRVLLRAVDADDAGLMYPSREARDAAVESGASWLAAEHVRRLTSSAHRMALVWHDLPAGRLAATVSGTAGWTRPVADVPWMRWRELALHAVDLGWPAGFAPGDPLVARLLDEAAHAWAGRPDAPPMVLTDTTTGGTWQVGDGGPAIGGTTADLALWLTGRSDGSALSASGALPALPPWL